MTFFLSDAHSKQEVVYSYFVIEQMSDDYDGPGWVTLRRYKTFAKGLEGLHLAMKDYICEYLSEDQIDEAFNQSSVNALLDEELDHWQNPKNYRIKQVGSDFAVVQHREEKTEYSVEDSGSEFSSKLSEALRRIDVPTLRLGEENDGWINLKLRLVSKTLEVVEE